ncbi:Heterogeneous nuclear ribonucleoprotein [Mycena sanguinolenta]|uniref:Heterogeneous nuclear ribonucleoprotein n=1 Tax=Mycena sanguinolenta TaxID=230812 RepID=A0A8H7CT50_9AGAR|nr:Heterogeneous nuclear ribonucleoprotein [Mycena sanguinolenta]
MSSSKLYIGNLSYRTDDDSLRNCFSSFGNVIDCIVMKDRDSGRSRGFGFVTYSGDAEAQQAIDQMNEQELDGRRLRVNLANSKPSGGGGGGGHSGGGGGYGGGGYGGGGGGYGNNSGW